MSELGMAYIVISWATQKVFGLFQFKEKKNMQHKIVSDFCVYIHRFSINGKSLYIIRWGKVSVFQAYRNHVDGSVYLFRFYQICTMESHARLAFRCFCLHGCTDFQHETHVYYCLSFTFTNLNHSILLPKSNNIFKHNFKETGLNFVCKLCELDSNFTE